MWSNVYHQSVRCRFRELYLSFNGRKNRSFRLGSLFFYSALVYSFRLHKPEKNHFFYSALVYSFHLSISSYTGLILGKTHTSYIRMTLGCLMSFMVEISRLICRKKNSNSASASRKSSTGLAWSGTTRLTAPTKQRRTRSNGRRRRNETPVVARLLPSKLVGGRINSYRWSSVVARSYLFFRQPIRFFRTVAALGKKFFFSFSERRQIRTQRDLLNSEEKCARVCRMWSDGKERGFKFRRTCKGVFRPKIHKNQQG